MDEQECRRNEKSLADRPARFTKTGPHFLADQGGARQGLTAPPYRTKGRWDPRA